jgi:ribosome biogenesis GTPase
VAARIVAADFAIVEAVLPRRTLFSRRAPGKREEQQPIAANIDLVFVVCGLDGDFNLRRLERYLAISIESGVTPVIVLNKADICVNLDASLAATAPVARGAMVVTTAASRPGGVDELAQFLRYGRTIALLGSSGVGKSTIANGLIGEERIRTREVRESDSRGRHTTTHRELIPLPGGGALIDTPGMRELQLWAGEDSIESAFDEIAVLALECRYRDCSHSGEPGCAVRAALEAGDLDPARFESYRKLLAEARRHERLADPLAALEQKRKWKQIHKAVKRMYRARE